MNGEDQSQLMTSTLSRGAPIATDRVDELAEIITAYNQVTEKLQHSHELLQAEVQRLQKELAGANVQLQRARRLAALGEMAAGIAHEIRNPLGGIGLYARMLREDLPEGSDQQQMATRIAEAVRALDAIVGDVLHFSRELKPRKAPVLAGILFDRALAAHRPNIDATGVRVRRDGWAEGDARLAIDGDVDLLGQAVLNVVRNAVEAMAGEEGCAGVPVEQRELHLGVRGEAGQVVLSVADRGPGIAEQNIDRLFNPFFTTRQTGTGLGLAIVHRIVDAHGGTVTVHNDGGAVFELWLPAAEAECDPAIRGDDEITTARQCETVEIGSSE